MADKQPAEPQPEQAPAVPQAEPAITEVNATVAKTRVSQVAIADLGTIRREEAAGANRSSVHESIARRVKELQERGTHHVLELADLAQQRWHVQPSVAMAAMEDLGVDHLSLEDADQLIPAFAKKEAK